MKPGLIPFFIIIAFNGFSQDRLEYINTYKDIAVVEMHRTGIPASIKLAQGILESNAGASMLAERANNHFGIKCGSAWKGKTMLRKDDDRNAHGKLMKSCFRAFSSAEESYVAHSDFLLDPNKKHRYGFLFGLASDDYRGWARGLKKAGYATNPNYPALLIRIIEQYQLYKIDQDALGMIAEVANEDARVMKGDKQSAKSKKIVRSTPDNRAYPVKYHNSIKIVTAYGGDSPVTIAARVGMNAKKIVKYNESIGSEYETFKPGQKVYLQAKKGKYKGAQKYHIVKQGETMLEIADKYGIKVAKLYQKNGMLPGLQPARGQRIALNKKNKGAVKVISHARPERGQIGTSSGVDDLDVLKPSSKKYLPASGSEGSSVKAKARSMVTRAIYTVQPNDTLYRIARKHGLDLETLRKMNNLADDKIHPGQKLKLEE
jgi:LysM repeat protein